MLKLKQVRDEPIFRTSLSLSLQLLIRLGGIIELVQPATSAAHTDSLIQGL